MIGRPTSSGLMSSSFFEEELAVVVFRGVLEFGMVLVVSCRSLACRSAIVRERTRKEMKLIKKTKRTTGFILFLIQNHFTVKKTKRQKLMLKRSQFQPLFSKKRNLFIEKG